jgi:hypothetical protein
VRNRIFNPIGLSGVDDFYTGPLPETIYFDKGKKAVPDNINIPGVICYDQTSDNMVLTAGSGTWTLSAEEYSLFISKLWLGKIISPASVTEMLPQNDQKALALPYPLSTAVGIGMYGSLLEHGGKAWWNYTENGAGCDGAGDWMTFLNGYTAVLLWNTDWDPGNLLQDSFAAALTP